MMIGETVNFLGIIMACRLDFKMSFVVRSIVEYFRKK